MATAFLLLAVGGKAAEAKALQAAGLYCEDAIAAAAQVHSVPNPLMTAVGLVETGRQDRATGAWRPWPWTINAEGKGFFFDSKSEAVAAVRSLQAIGIRSIDVGCMQVNLLHHPDAFATLEEAFDPKRNANYAGRFLNQLFRRSGDWMIAAGWYHSTTSDLAADYVKRVTAILPRGKLSLILARGDLRPDPVKNIRPLVNRDGVILPSVRLNASSLLPARSLHRKVGATAAPGPRFGDRRLPRERSPA